MSGQQNECASQRSALIIGCGYLGSHVAGILRQDGWKVTVTTTRTERAQTLAAAGFHVEVFDYRQADSFDRLVAERHDAALCATAPGRDGDPETVFRTGPRTSAERLLANGAKRFVLVSSTGVYHQNDGSWVTEESLAEPQEPRYRLLRASEEDVLTRGGTVLRLGGLYGPGRSPVDWLRRPEMLARIRSGNGDAWMSWIRVEDAARLCALALERGVERRIYLGVDGHPVQRAAFYARAAELARLPPPEFASSSPDLGKRCANRVTCEALGFQPLHASFYDGLVGTSMPG